MIPDNIRHAIEDDLPRIIEIYNSSIPGRQATAELDPVSPESRLDWLKGHSPAKYPLWVCEHNGEIVGWVALRPFYGRPAYHSTAEISVYLAPEMQGQGLGGRLVGAMIDACPALGVKSLLAFVFGHNEASLKVFERTGFERWGHLPGVAQLDTDWRDLVILGRKV